MSEQEILEGNKLIAEFMGYKIPNQTHKLNWIVYKDVFQPMLFNTSWDWLMPAIKECLNKSEENLADWEYYYEQIDDSFFQIEIHQTWSAVVEFIKWYNSCQK